MLRHEPSCPATTGVAEICTCGAIFREASFTAAPAEPSSRRELTPREALDGGTPFESGTAAA